MDFDSGCLFLYQISSLGLIHDPEDARFLKNRHERLDLI